MTKNKKQKIQKKFSRQHLAMTLVLAVALTLGAWLAVVWPSAFAEADSEGHVHSVLCYDGVALNCAETDEAHEHTLNCLTGIELTCSEDHVHSLDCYAATSAELVCGVAEGQEAEHVHNMPGWECVPVKILTCTQPEHTHTAACQPEILKPTVDPKQDDGGYVIYETGVEESNDPLDPYDGPDVKDDEYGGFGGDDDFGFGGDDDNFGVDPGLDDDFGVDPEDPGTEGGDTDPADTEGGDTNPADTEGGDTDPADTEGGETNPADTEGGETDPADTEGGDTNPADTEGGETNPADTEDGDTDPADTEGTTNLAAKKIYGLPVPLTELPENLPAADTATDYACGQTEHVHGTECYTVVWLCRQTVVINVPELPTSGTLNLLDGVTVEPAEIDGKPLQVMVAAVDAEDAKGNYHEPQWDTKANTLTVEADVTYEVTYVAYYLSDEPTEDSAMFALAAAEDGEQAGFPVMAGLLKVQARGNSGSVARIGTVEYPTLQKAIKAAEDAGTETTIVLLKDTQEKITITKGNITLTSEAGESFTISGNKPDNFTPPTPDTAVNYKNNSVITITGGTFTLNGNITITGGTGSVIATNPQPGGQWYETYTAGGGVLVAGGTFNLQKGTISGNEANKGGGIYVMPNYVPNKLSQFFLNSTQTDGGTFVMTGGTVTNNSTQGVTPIFTNKADGNPNGNFRAGEGGGIFIASKTGNEITGGSITDNKCNTTMDWGGGGVYVNSEASLTIKNAVITDNTAKGLGGGISGCPHADIFLSIDDGAVLYENKAQKDISPKRYPDEPYRWESKYLNNVYVSGNGTGDYLAYDKDPGFTADKAMDFYCVDNCKVVGQSVTDEDGLAYIGRRIEITSDVPDKLFGTNSATDHETVQISAGDVSVKQNDTIAVVRGSLGLTAVGRPTSVTNSVMISGNSSTTHGGGIACNGDLILGTRTIENESGNSWPVEIQKQLVAPDGVTSWPMNAGQFEFKLLAENQTTEIATGTNDAKGKVRFIVDNEKYIGSPGGETYTFYVQEVSGNEDNITYNTELHGVKVNVTLKTTEINLDGNTTTTIKNSFAELLTEPENLTITNTLKSGDLSITKKVVEENPNLVPDTKPIFTFTVNIPKLASKEYTFNTKLYSGEDKDNATTGTITFTDGKATVTLSDKQTILIDGLPAGVEYTVTEQDTEDYTLVNSENEKGTITANVIEATGAVTDNTAKVTFTNKRDLVNLAVTKNVELGTGSAEAPNEEFIINVQIGSNEKTIQNAIFADDNVKTTWYIGDGVYRITLKAGETATIHGIPNNTSYKVVEESIPNGFTLTTDAEDLNGILTGDKTGENAVVLQNHYFKTKTLDIPFEKTWSGIPEGGNALYPSSITVQLNRSWQENNELKSEMVEEREIFRGADGKWSHTFTKLHEYKAENVPYTYSVKEIDIDYNTESAAALVAYLDKQAQTYGKHFHDVENVDEANNTFKILGNSVTTAGQRDLLGIFTVAGVDSSDYDLVNTWIPASDTGENSFKVVKQTADENPTKLPGAVFRLTDANGLVREAETDKNGEAVFSLLPEGTYTLTEYKAPLGYQINPTEWTVDVKKELTSVSDESGAWLNTWTWTTDITGGEAGVLTVTDELITGKISITKALAMDTPELAAAFANQNFVFNIYAGETPDAEAEPVATLTVQPGQTATTEDLPFGVYTIREVNPPQELGNSAYKGVTFVQGETRTNGSIVVNIAEQQAEPVAVTATNNYTGFPSYAPQVNKVITGANVPATVFNFTLAAADGNNAAGYTMPEQLTATVNGAGTASFGNILFKQAGTYNFTITEQNDGYTGFTYDESVWTLTVTVAEESGNLAVTNANYTKEGVATANAAQFTNTYTEQRPASVNITVRKAWAGVPEGQALPANAQMQLMRNGEAFGPVVAVNAAGGWAYTWDNLATADAEGNPYTYTVAEVNVPEGYQSVVTSDGNIFTVTNTYQEPATGSLTISKVLAGNALTDEIRGREFTVQLLLFAADGQTPLAGAYPYSGATNGTVGHEGTIVLRGGQSVTVTGLPENTIYRVVETDANGASMTETFYSDLGLPHVINDGDADTVEVRNVFNTTTPDNPGGGDEGDNTPELPNPNDPGTPDEITIYDDDVPLTYMKVQDPNNEEEFVYLPEDEVPLAEMPVPKTGDTSRTGWLALFTLLSLTGLAVLIAKKPKQEA